MKLDWKTTYRETAIVKECRIPLDEKFQVYLFRKSQIYEDCWQGYIDLQSGNTRRNVETFPPPDFVGGYPEKTIVRMMKSSLRKIFKNFHKNSFTK